MPLDESIDIIISVLGKFFDDRLYDMYSKLIVFSEDNISFEEYKEKCKMANITSQSFKSSEEIKKENENILARFFKKEVKDGSI